MLTSGAGHIHRSRRSHAEVRSGRNGWRLREREAVSCGWIKLRLIDLWRRRRDRRS